MVERGDFHERSSLINHNVFLLPILHPLCIHSTFQSSQQARNIFDFKNGDYSDAEYGIQVPQGIVLHVARQTSTFMEDFADEEEYVRRRLGDLQVHL